MKVTSLPNDGTLYADCADAVGFKSLVYFCRLFDLQKAIVINKLLRPLVLFCSSVCAR